MAGRFPGASDVAQFWRNILAGVPTTSRFTPEELAADGVPEQDLRSPDYVPVFGALPDVELFDAGFFGYSPRDASLLDPQQRLFLECAWEALEGSGQLVPEPGDVVGVYAGAGTSSYLLHNVLGNPRLPAGVTEYDLLLANDKDSLATRVAYHLDLRGPAVTVQTACSSSLVAVHLAAQALLAHDCDVALAGGAHVRLPLRSGHRYVAGGIMSRSGHCRPFDAAADGTVGGSGVAAVVLRRLEDAMRGGDTIYAVVRGSAVTNDGGVKVGFTAPSVQGQAAAIRMAHAAAGVLPGSISYVETHGTGTSLGDRIEARALVEAFGPAVPVGGCALGAVKALIGHLDAAAGVAGLIKAVLALHHGVIPPNPYVSDPGGAPDLGLAASPFRLNAEPVPWPERDTPPRAGVSSFGIGGTNAHVVLERAALPARVPVPVEPMRPAQLLVLSARSAPALAQLRQRLAAHLREGGATAARLADVAFTLQTTRRRFAHRITLVCRAPATAAAALDGVLRPDGGPAPTVRTAVDEAVDRPVAFLFPGQGAQHVGMADELYRTEPSFRNALDHCAALLRPHLDQDLRDVLYPDANMDAGDAEARLRATGLAQPALFAVGYALAGLWQQWGVRPVAMLGHSLGEYVAACLAGVLSLEDALATVAVRGRLMQAMPAGVMLSVPLPAAELEPLLPAGTALAADNAPRLSVASGPADAVAELAERLRGRGVECRRMRTSHAFHSPMMDGAAAPFREHLRRIALHPPRLPVVSNVTGGWLTADEATDPEYWVRQLRRPVRFAAGAQVLLAQDVALLEVGPGTTLSTLVRQQHPQATAIASLGAPASARADGVALADALGRLWLAGVELDWAGVWAGDPRRRVALPTHPFLRERHWIERTSASVTPANTHPQPSGAPTELPARACSQPPSQAAVSGDPVVDVIRRIWVELLGVADIGPSDDFFELGGHSLLGTQVTSRIRDELSVDLSPGAVFESPTIAGLAVAVHRARAAADPVPQEPPEEVADLLAEILALSPEEVQEQLDRAQQAHAVEEE
ncbi:MAG: acyltransferase domain-containing protein [Actinobacteria bacterium]|nr:acyltransferase domain-containing protein [Actinomycetota bacterium]